MKNDILMWHGVDPPGVQMIRNQLNPKKNQCRALSQAEIVPDARGSSPAMTP
jgi:hypothetical protein